MSARIEGAVRSPADVYDDQFVPALFRHWGPVVCDAANITAGQRVLDVACGTGALTVAVAERVSPGGAALGLDSNPEMLAVAQRKHPDIEWHRGCAESLPFADAEFDAVVSQFGLMFFDDRVAALREMQRVLRPGGRLVVAVCNALERSPAYASLAVLLERLFGKTVADAFRAPFVLGDAAALRALCVAADITDATIVQCNGIVRFASIDLLVSTERACVWTLGGQLDATQFELLRDEAQDALLPFVDAGGMVSFAMPALLITAAKR
ncbi:class I SAM-dependent methyltransferase [Variovorax sp. J22R115]|uniref:class I SAM-dependent methyltransferase n=1 Tax=Variovorax sp. J22R115 TaxID=3053509 RepID=UPI0025762C54|nr:class I SAM-dependent methyltransferase [Variovorax sp. J22R115]MDM0050578.1 class I SAM-dependent methyltransferase [Variovorax sp. J22R115]